MKALARTTLVVLLVFTVSSSVIYASCVTETVVPYNFPSGLINIIQHSENPDTPFWHWIKEKYPLIRLNYTVQQDGWLDISAVLRNGTRPEIILNDELVYRTQNHFLHEQVYAGDFYQLVLFPPENLNNTFSMLQDGTILTVYELYTWDAMIGELMFSESPRPEINTSFTWDPVDPVEGDVLVFSASCLHEGDHVSWTLGGPDGSIEDQFTHFITDPLDDGEHDVTLHVEDVFGYGRNESRTFYVAPNNLTILMNPTLTSINISDIYASSVEANQLADVTIRVDYSTPVSRDIQVTIKDQNGETLCNVVDQVSGEGSQTYSLSFASSNSDMSLDANVEFLHDGQWINNEVRSFVLPVTTPVNKSKAIPGYPIGAILLGIGFYLKSKYW